KTGNGAASLHPAAGFSGPPPSPPGHSRHNRLALDLLTSGPILFSPSGEVSGAAGSPCLAAIPRPASRAHGASTGQTSAVVPPGEPYGRSVVASGIERPRSPPAAARP